MESTEIKFSYIVKNIHFNKIHNVIISLKEFESKNTLTWIWSDNAEIIARRRFTHLLDKNKKEIFERDIVSFMYKNPQKPLSKLEAVFCQVVWNKEKGMWSLEWSDGYINNYFLNCDKIEVVGNIYQNKELWK